MIHITKDIELNGEELAREFWEKDCVEQAEFFNKNKFADNNWNHGRAIMQIDYFTELLDDNGREFIKQIYDSMQACKEREENQDRVLENASELEADYDVDVSDCEIN